MIKQCRYGKLLLERVSRCMEVIQDGCELLPGRMMDSILLQRVTRQCMYGSHVNLLVFQTFFQFLDKTNNSLDPCHVRFTFDLLLSTLVCCLCFCALLLLPTLRIIHSSLSRVAQHFVGFVKAFDMSV